MEGEPEHLFSALEVVIKTLLKVGMVGRRAGEHVYGLTDFTDSGTMSGNFSVRVSEAQQVTLKLMFSCCCEMWRKGVCNCSA